MVMGSFATLLLISALVCVIIESEAIPTGRIVGGNDAYNGQFPHQISLRLDNSHHCGGSIITRNYVITAAHCVFGKSPNNFTLRAGSISRLQDGVIAKIAAITIHDDYGNLMNDVALLRLQTPLIFSSNIQPIKLTPQPMTPGETIQISGWGRLKSFGEIPINLQWTNVTVLTRDQCKKESGFDTDKIVCLSHPTGTGACDGDSGGPATYDGTLVGISSFTFGRCGTDFPDGYAQVSTFYDWILEHSDLTEYIEETIEH